MTADFCSKTFLQQLTTRPGIYKMLDSGGDIIYIGKAKNLQKRVASYFNKQNTSPKQAVMVSKIANIEVTLTNTEGEALLLESQQVKKYQPRYNICLRDDKSYPYLFISDHDYPRLQFHRGAKRKKGEYFGPYPSSGAVKETLNLLPKIFPVRQCEDSYFNNRSRPCLQHQIGRCSAPCVGLVERTAYQEDVAGTVLFLQGKSGALVDLLIEKMAAAAKNLAFERAAIFRDQIAKLRQVLAKNFVHSSRGNVDIIACATAYKTACVQVFFIRGGQNLGDKTFFPKINNDCSESQLLEAFIGQYYLQQQIPQELFVSHQLPQSELLAQMLSQEAGHSVAISCKVRGERLKWLQIATTNAANSLASKLANKQDMFARYLNLQQLLGLPQVPKLLECFDISHTAGTHTVASCVVFDQQGAVKSSYRRFNIDGITPGDDCAAIHQAVSRRYQRLQNGEHHCPDILFIDGGYGQVQRATQALEELQVQNVTTVGVSKGEGRKAQNDKLLLAGQKRPLNTANGTSAMLLIQQIRDEAHRFAITAHRGRRARAKKESILEGIQGLGPKRRQSLLVQFGGLQGVIGAGVDGLCSINGISKPLAQRIYDNLH